MCRLALAGYSHHMPRAPIRGTYLRQPHRAGHTGHSAVLAGRRDGRDLFVRTGSANGCQRMNALVCRGTHAWVGCKPCEGQA